MDGKVQIQQRGATVREHGHARPVTRRSISLPSTRMVTIGELGLSSILETNAVEVCVGPIWLSALPRIQEQMRYIIIIMNWVSSTLCIRREER